MYSPALIVKLSASSQIRLAMVNWSCKPGLKANKSHIHLALSWRTEPKGLARTMSNHKLFMPLTPETYP